MLTGELTTETGDTVRIHFLVENTGQETETVTFRDGGHADCVVRDGDDEVWRWSAGQMFTQALSTERIEPGDTLDYGFEWEAPENGAFTVRAELRGDVECSAETSLSVE